MLNCIKESFNLTNKYIILATPLILFSLLSSLYILFSLGGNLVSLLIALVLFILMLAAFISGWSFMLKTCVQEPERDDPNSLIKDFPAGVGEYFLSVLGLIFIVAVLSIGVLGASYAAGMKLIGNIGISSTAMSGALESTVALKSFLMSLTDEQLFRLNAWNLLLLITMGLEYFLILFYIPAMFFKSKNPFKALFLALKDLFSKKFFGNLGLYLILFISYSILSILTTIFGLNVITHFIFTLINFYYMVFIAVLVFNYYYVNFVKIGGKLDERV